tara:strand:+ start:696 stop:1469 length:774 start_codon:yes stop_codon:yes gene_type:complete
MAIDYNQLKEFVREAMVHDGPGGSMAPSAPEVPHRMPAADPTPEEGDETANELYYVALDAREATEKLVVALDDPIFDEAYENAFKASACLRKVLNSLEDGGAKPAPYDRVVAPPRSTQKYASASSGPSFGGGDASIMGMVGALEEADEGEEEDSEEAIRSIGTGTVTQQAQAQQKKQSAAGIAAGEELSGVDGKERNMLQQVDALLTNVAEEIDMTIYKPLFKNFFKVLGKAVKAEKMKRQKSEKTAPGAGETEVSP